MHVLPSTLTWLFDGVGGAALIALIGLVFKWFKSKGQRPTGAGLTAQGAKVTGSPVASGTGITQTISETHHHHYGPEVTPPAAQSSAPAPEREAERPRPNLKIVGGKKILIHTGLNGAFYQSEAGRAHGEAVIAKVTNDARRDAANFRAVIKATLIYQDSAQELLRGMGSWLGEVSGMVGFGVDDSHSVVLGVVINGEFSVPTKRRVTHGFGSVSFLTDPNPLNCERATVTVRLTNADTGDLYCEEQFEVVPDPLQISAI
jgi:hypothetical protein